MDLKVYGDGNYVLWMVDDATRLIRGEAIKSKDPDTIIAAMERIWINGYGMGPGMPEKYIFTDNGGEFLNEKMLNLCQEAGIKLKNTGSYSPQQNGVNERNHGVTDIMVEKYRREDPNLTLQDAINKAAFAKNSLIHSQTGFSPFQLVFGRNPVLQMTSESTTGGLENLSGNEMARSMLYKQEQARIAMEIAEHDMRLKIAARDRLPANTKYMYEIGDYVVFRDGRDGKRHDAKIVGFDGSIALLRWGNMDRRVPERDLLPSHEKREIIEDKDEVSGREEEEIVSDTEVIPEIVPRKRGPKRQKKVEIIPEIPEKKVFKESKRWKNTEEEDQQPTLEVWSEDEDCYKEKNKCLTMPILGEHIDMWNLWGEKFSGQVEKIKKSKPHFRIKEHETDASVWVELDNLNFWEYTRPPDPNKRLDTDGKPSKRAELAEIDRQEMEYEWM